MTVSYAASLKTTRMQAVLSAIDAGAAGTIEIGTANMATVLAILPLQKPSFSLSGAVLTLLGVPISATAGASGTAANARIKDGSGNVIVSQLTVGTTGTDIILNSVAITSGQAVTLNSGTISHSP